jgi:hypothetical protein
MWLLPDPLLIYFRLPKRVKLLNRALENAQKEIELLRNRVDNLQNQNPQLIDVGLNEEALRSLMKLIHPVQNSEYGLVRYGSVLDGGYEVLKEDFMDFNVISFGIGGNADFENQFISKGSMVWAFDHTIEKFPEISHLGSPNLKYFKQGLAASASDLRSGKHDLIGLHDAYSKLENLGKGNLLKIDVEGDEWAALDLSSQADLIKFNQILIEFHELSDTTKFDLYSRVFKKLTSTFYVIYLGLNNHSATLFGKNLLLTDSIEVTFVNKQLYNRGNWNPKLIERHLPSATFRTSICQVPIY